jgi:hypothetical protein
MLFSYLQQTILIILFIVFMSSDYSVSVTFDAVCGEKGL